MNARIFISYSHRGNGPEWKAWLARHLGVFEQHHLLDVWQDGKIRVSSFWDDDIKQAMGSARVAVVLLTKEALELEYILKTEFSFHRERQQRDKLPVFPAIGVLVCSRARHGDLMKPKFIPSTNLPPPAPRCRRSAGGSAWPESARAPWRWRR